MATTRGACTIAGRRHDVEKKAKRGDWGGVKDGQVITRKRQGEPGQESKRRVQFVEEYGVRLYAKWRAGANTGRISCQGGKYDETSNDVERHAWESDT